MIKGKSNRLTGKAQLSLCCGAHQVFCSSLLTTRWAVLIAVVW